MGDLESDQQHKLCATSITNEQLRIFSAGVAISSLDSSALLAARVLEKGRHSVDRRAMSDAHSKSQTDAFRYKL